MRVCFDKYHRGRATRNVVWVFGMCDTNQSPALGVMCIVQDRTAQTLLPLLRRHLRSGTVVHSDQWAAYNQVQQLQPVSDSEPLTELCRSSNWSPYAECGVILE